MSKTQAERLQKLNEAKATYEKEEKVIKTKIDSIKNRLMARAKIFTVNVPIQDNKGKFYVTCRVFTRAEQNTVLDLFRQLDRLRKKISPKTKKQDKTLTEKYLTTETDNQLNQFEEIENKLYELLAYPDGICLVEELDLEYWKSGKYTTDLPYFIAQYVIAESANAMKKALQDVDYFRKE